MIQPFNHVVHGACYVLLNPIDIAFVAPLEGQAVNNTVLSSGYTTPAGNWIVKDGRYLVRPEKKSSSLLSFLKNLRLQIKWKLGHTN